MARLIALILCFCATSVAAQVWRTTKADDGHFLYFSAGANAGFGLTCLAPSLQRRPAIEVGAHETSAMGPGTTRIEMSRDRLSPATNESRSDVVLWVDQTGYRLPVVQWNELVGHWELDLPSDDPLWAALAVARSVVLAPGAEQAWQLPVQDLGLALRNLQTECGLAWAAAQTGVAQSPEPLAAVGGQVVSLPPALARHVQQGCGAPAAIPSAAVQAGDLDKDGVPDFVLDWGGIHCPGALARPFCGAANCSHNIFLSSRGYAKPEEMLGTSVTVIAHWSGGLALLRSGTYSVCGAHDEYCAAPLVWDGNTFSERP